ncbi:unnamed protein product [Sympodiomycopsis kandeliae]
MKFLALVAAISVCLSFLSISGANALSLEEPAAISKRDFQSTIFTPPSNYQIPRTLYGRSLLLKQNDEASKGTLLATWENYSGGKTWFPIYKSTDHGFTWKEISKVQDQVNGWGFRYQPTLYELPEAFGGYPKGSILLAGNSIPSDLSKTKLDLYVSTDKGVNWKFLSSFASGGKALPNNGETPVWEPFLLLHKKQLVVYYSDQRDPKYGQKIVHQVTSDMKKWGPVVDDVADKKSYDARPGMPIISPIGNTGNWIYTFEYGNAKAPYTSFQAFYKISNDPLSWDDKEWIPVQAKDGTVPVGSPYNVWTPVGGSNGTIVMNAQTDGALYLNKANGDRNSWTRLNTASPGQYTRSLAVGFNPKDIVIVGGGVLEGKSNTVTLVATDVNGCTSC